MTSVGGLFVEAVARTPDAPCLRHVGGATLSYAEMGCRVAETMRELQGLGLKRGEMVVCFLEDTIPSITFVLAASLLGVIPALLSPVFSTRYLKALGQKVGARYVLTQPQLAHAVEVAGFLALHYSTHSDRRGAEGRLRSTPLVRFDEAQVALTDASSRIGAEDVFVVQPTSGSTGEPKLVLRPHRAFLRYADWLGREAVRESTPPPRFLIAGALTHAFGLHMLTTALAVGGELDIATALDTAMSLRDARTLDPTVLAVTPRVLRSFYRQSMASEEAEGAALFGPSLRLILSAGGRSDPALAKVVIDQHVDLVEFYGSSEASLIAVTPRGGWVEGYAGRVLPDVALRRAEDGELLVRTPGLMLGYHGDPEHTAAAYDEDGFFRTGDIGDVSREGFVRILGRKRDVFNTPEGSNIYPERIEVMIELLPHIHQVILVGDGEPFITAFIAMDAASHRDGSSDSYLAPADARALYKLVGDALGEVNLQLESIETVKAFALFDRPFPSDLYAPVGSGKVRRDRKRFKERFATRIAALYDPALPPHSPHRVRGPGRPRPVAGLPLERIPLRARAILHFNDAAHPTTTVDLTMRGALVENPNHLVACGEKVRLELFHGASSASTTASVVHGSSVGLGLSFLDPDAKFLVFVGELLEGIIRARSRRSDTRQGSDGLAADATTERETEAI